MHPMVNTAITAARQAGTIIMRAFDNKSNLNISEKGRHDYVTQIDKAAETAIIKVLQDAYPDHNILAEESGEHISRSNKNNQKYQWIIDPLDGTLNFINGFPHFCVSIALKVNNKVEHGIIYDPIRNELFTASRGGGANLENKRMRVNNASSIDGSFLATGFPVRQANKIEACLKTFNNILIKAADIRTAGSAALDLAYVAAGRLDGYWEEGLAAWDLAAGGLLVVEAGGYAGDYTGSEDYLDTGAIIAGNIKIYKSLLQEINKK